MEGYHADPSDQALAGLAKAHPKLGTFVHTLVTKGHTPTVAWLIMGAIEAYTGIGSIPTDILKATGTDPKAYPKIVGDINNFLRGKNCSGSREQFEALETLLRAIEDLPDFDSRKCDPTRMMDDYPDLANDYQVGNVLLMAEVGSVSRAKPKGELYKKRYRVHVEGGLKDISVINPQQEEVIYAPGSAYLVVNRETGKDKKTVDQGAHEHIYLRYISRTSADYAKAKGANKVFDLRDPNRHKK